MKHYQRLLVLGVLSALLHVLAIKTIGPTALAPREAPAAPIVVRLQAPPTPVPSVPVPSVPPPSVPPAPAPAQLAPLAAAVAVPAPSAPAAPETAPDTAPAAALPKVEMMSANMQNRYRVRTPPSSTLDYVVTRHDGAQAPAQITWTTDGKTYTVAVDGVTGPLRSTGTIGDNGIAPAEGSMGLANGGTLTASFGPNSITVGALSYANGVGIQDPASLLLQLVGMGLAQPDQIVDEVAIEVASAEGLVEMRFAVTVDEDLPTPLGVIGTRHLRQLAGNGQPVLEVWLAPALRWLPVQLRLTAADGTVTTQTITRMDDRPAVN
ncbi:DUF3108 domain-containing protein [Massilia sp. S19_KUP03_FR1]|uniref:DUF3108 domain-containing protein n=1 Tax=Massilia sp. S19_KUP03_FR1 TaxID=3025503 RepID=UPI002FCDDDE7